MVSSVSNANIPSYDPSNPMGALAAPGANAANMTITSAKTGATWGGTDAGTKQAVAAALGFPSSDKLEKAMSKADLDNIAKLNIALQLAGSSNTQATNPQNPVVPIINSLVKLNQEVIASGKMTGAGAAGGAGGAPNPWFAPSSVIVYLMNMMDLAGCSSRIKLSKDKSASMPAR